MLGDSDAWKRSDELIAFFEAADALGIADYLIFDPTVIRGLDYYTGTVFEAREATGAERAILGGGRYDNLVAAVGGDPIPGVGFAMGDVVLQLVLESHGLIPELRPNPADVLLVTFDQDLLYKTLEVATQLRNSGIRVEWYPKPARIPKQFKYADRQGIPFAAIMGPDEAEQGMITIKDLRSREQKTMRIKDAASYLLALG
jgi:histidyl-tRNA synthetase